MTFSVPHTPKQQPLVHQLGQALSMNLTLLLSISGYAIVCLREICTLHLLQEFFIVGDDDELEIWLVLSALNDHVE